LTVIIGAAVGAVRLRRRGHHRGWFCGRALGAVLSMAVRQAIGAMAHIVRAINAHSARTPIKSH
jgi:hypothetical protein